MRVAAIDQGTTSTRCLVIEEGGGWSVAASRRHAHKLPQPGWVEHDPEELLANVRAALAAAGPVDCIGIANQGESCLAWDGATGKALSPVIVWQDARTKDALEQLSAEAQAMSKRICGLPLDPYFSASKFAWILQNLPEAAKAQKNGHLRLGTTDAFFLDRLTGRFVTDRATASRTGLLDLATGQWSPELCKMHGVPEDSLPEIVDVDADFGTIGGTPVRASIVDQQAALRGHGCRKAGDCKVTFGTGAFLLAITGETRPQDHDLLPTIAWAIRHQPVVYAIEGGVYDAGSALEWARKIGLFESSDELAEFEGPSAISRGLVFIPALSGLAAPHWDRTAAPLFIGMDHSTERRDLVRAVLEGVAMLTVGLLRSAGDIIAPHARVSIDGGVSQSPYFVRFLASACQRTIVAPKMHELTALGLADLCGLDASAVRAEAVVCEPDDYVTVEDHRRFAEALRRSCSWRA